MRKKFLKLRHGYAVEHRKRVRTLKILSRHPFVVPVVTFAFLIAVSIVGYSLLHKHDAPVLNAYVVIISHDHEEQTVPSRQPTVGALLKKLNITLNQGDVVEPAVTTAINQEDFRINIYRAVPVEIVDGNQRIFTLSAATTPRSIAAQSGLTVYPEDSVTTIPTTNFLSAGAIGEQVVLNRATPVSLNLYGTSVPTRTRAKTVADLISEKHIKLAKTDQVVPALATPITANIPIFIVRNGTKLESVTAQIATPVQTIQDSTLAYGTSAIRQAGSPGQQVTTYQDNLQNGVVVSRTVVQNVITVNPVTEIVVQGTSLSGIKGDMALAGISSSDYQYADYIISNESGWCPTKAQGEHTCPALPDNQFTSYGYGLCQATPGSKMSSAGADWATNPITQLKWCNGYAVSRYGSWYNAYVHWMNNRNW